MRQKFLLCVYFLFLLSFQTRASWSYGSQPQLLTWDGAALYQLRIRLNDGEPNLSIEVLTALEHLRKISGDLEKSISDGKIPLVTNKTTWPKGASQNHFVSYVPYAHPCNLLPSQCVDYSGTPVNNSDCDFQTALPWRICDNRLNIRARDLYTDRPKLEAMMHAVIRLSLSAYVFQSKQYADAAVTLLDSWFVSNHTNMLPTLRYAQGIPGVVDGKHSGCIDLSLFGRGFTDAVILLQQTPESSWSQKSISVFQTWCANMLNEMLHYPRVSAEGRMRNNHGLFYDLTVLSLSSLIRNEERPAQVKDMLSDSCADWRFCVRGRLEDQINEEGAQVHELHRPGFGHYVWYTLLAHVHLYSMSQVLGFDYPIRSSPMMRIVAWTSKNWKNITGMGDEWQIYGVQAYRLIGRMNGSSELENAACELLEQMRKRFGNRGVWHEGRVGMDVWNIVYPMNDEREKCNVWNHYTPFLINRTRNLQTSVKVTQTNVTNGDSKNFGSIGHLGKGFNVVDASHAQWVPIVSAMIWFIMTKLLSMRRGSSGSSRHRAGGRLKSPRVLPFSGKHRRKPLPALMEIKTHAYRRP